MDFRSNAMRIFPELNKEASRVENFHNLPAGHRPEKTDNLKRNSEE
jgi:hypothetical protein